MQEVKPVGGEVHIPILPPIGVLVVDTKEIQWCDVDRFSPLRLAAIPEPVPVDEVASGIRFAICTVWYQGTLALGELVFMLSKFYPAFVELLILAALRVVCTIVMCYIRRPFRCFVVFLCSLIVLTMAQWVMLMQLQASVSNDTLIAVTVIEGIHDLVGWWMVYKHREFVHC